MVLRGDGDGPRVLIAHRVVAPAMAEFQLEGLPAQRQAHDLVTETNAKHRPLPHQFAHDGHSISGSFGVPRAVGQENAIRLQRQRLGSRESGRHHGHITTGIDEVAQNIVLDAEVVSHHAIARSHGFGVPRHVPGFVQGLQPRIRLPAGDAAHKIEIPQSRGLPRSLHSFFRRHGTGDEGPTHGTDGADMARQSAGIDFGGCGDAAFPKVLRQVFSGSPV